MMPQKKEVQTMKKRFKATEGSLAAKRRKEEQILEILREAEKPDGLQEVLRKHQIHENTYYRWKKKYQGVNVEKVRRIRELEKENDRLKKLVADLSMVNQEFRDMFKKKEWI